MQTLQTAKSTTCGFDYLDVSRWKIEGLIPQINPLASFRFTLLVFSVSLICHRHVHIGNQYLIRFMCLYELDTLAGVPVGGKSTVCLICMKYWIIILIIIIKRLGEILLLYIANTSRTHARMHARTHASTHARTHSLTHPVLM